MTTKTKAMALIAVCAIVLTGAGCSNSNSNESATNNNPSTNTPSNSPVSCASYITTSDITVEPDPAGDPEAWLRFNYTSTASLALNCQYAITFYDSQGEIVRTIANTEDTFQSPSGQISNGYSSTPYQAGMTAKISVK